MQKFVTILALAFLASPAIADPKAYDLVKYRGRAAGLTIFFDFADGYPQASEVRISDAKGGKSTKFLLDESGEMHFAPRDNSDGDREVVLKMDPDDAPPAKVEGTYHAGRKFVSFVLTRQ